MTGTPNYGYHLARWEGRVVRGFYSLFLPVIARRPLPRAHSIDFEVFSYSGEKMLEEQVASIRSFLKHVGRPTSFTVVSDGSYSQRSIDLLRATDPSVTVVPPEPPPSNLPERFEHYLADHPTGKQLHLIMSLPRKRVALYVDSDVKFFPGAADIVNQTQAKGASALYLADCQFSGDERLIREESEKERPVNTGFLILFNPLDWSLAISRFLEMDGQPNFFTNQTMTHLTMHANGARPLDPARYLLQLDDQFVYGDRYAERALALRHYVNPVRHKFWTSLIR